MPSNGKAGSLSAPAGGEMLTRGRRTWATGQIAGATALAAAVFVTAFACILLTKELHNPAAVWLSDGIVIAVLLRQPRARWGAILGAGAIGVATANLAAGEGVVMSLGMAASNVLAMFTCAILVTRMVAQPRVDLTNPRHLPAFLIAGGVVAPMLASLAGVLVLRFLVGAPWWPTAPQWFVSESLGILLTTPAVLALGEGGLGRFLERFRSGRSYLPALTLVATLGVVFGQADYPLSFLLLPALLYCVLAWGAAGGALALLATAAVSILAAVNGLGPATFVEGGLGLKLGLSQALLASMALVMLPLTAIRVHGRRMEDAQRQALEASELAEQRLRLASQIAGIGYWRLEADAEEALWSDEAFALHGLANSGPGNAASGAVDLYSAEDRARLQQTVAQLFATGEAQELKVEIRRADNGQRRILLYKGQGQRDATGAVVALFGVVRDITDEETFLHQIEESEARYRLLADSSTDVVLKADAGVMIQYVSPSAARYGYDPDELIGKPGLSLVHPEDVDRVLAILAEVYETGEIGPTYEQAFRLRAADGSYVWMEGAPTILKDESGAITGIITPLRDVSERVAAQRELERSEARYRLITENATDIISCYGADSVFTYMSPAVTYVTGYAPEELVGRKTSEFIHPDDFARGRTLFADYMAAGPSAPPFRFEYRAYCKDGRMIWLEAHPRAVYDPETGAFVEFQDVVREITARKAIEEALAESEARYRMLAEHLTDIVSRARLSGELLYISPSVTKILGYSVEELDGVSMLPLVHPDDLAGVHAGYQEIIRGRAPEGFGITYRMKHKDGHWVWLESRPTAMRDAAGRVTGFVDLTRDVSTRVKLEDELREARDAAQAAAAVKAEFMANMSHEIRTPLTAILGFTSLLAARADLGEEERYQIGRISGAGQALLAIVNDILDFSKLEAGQMPILPKPVSPFETLSDALALFEPQAAAKGLRTRLDLAPDLPACLEIDPDRVRQILLNLIGNAVKFTDRGEVIVSAGYNGVSGRLRVSVRDTGPGMEPEEQAKLFKRFSQVDASAARRHGGTGLGLAICSGLVEAMGGAITVSSKVGRGSDFVFEIPTTQCVQPGPAEEAVQALDLSGLRVLVVDDNPVNRELAKSILAPFGAEVSEAGDGYEAIDVALDRPFDVILMDIRMPGMDGPDATLRIRAQPGPNQDTAILAFSADYDLERFGEQGGRGFDGFVRKPVELGALLGAIAACFAEEEVPAGA
ncbi:hypothetical protein DJ019_18150 [Phenylobacterium kunshanense]|uniref:histidine kinase n=2 Tax=Phenylobacterium kunshanense TaxID=1445034 RepID=A0A328B5Z2_9CAUL|nr:hypothetical protein DJ019_18150 [Phenylobacterium kunshanense]